MDPQTQQMAFTQYKALKMYLDTYFAKNQDFVTNQRTSAREKLTRLTPQQFQELSTDVYDEMLRRSNSSSEEPFLPVRNDFHPKRNQARQKLATLPKSRFKDLASDVFFELERRFPTMVDKKFEDQASASDSNFSTPASLVLEDKSSTMSPMVTGNTAQPSSAGVSFASLDNLMADLGTMFHTDKEQGPRKSEPSTSGISIKEHEEQLDLLKKRFESIISKNENEISNLQNAKNKLEAEVSQQIKQISALQEIISDQNNRIEIFKKKLNEQEMSFSIEKENNRVLALELDAVKSNHEEWKKKNDELLFEKEKDAVTIRKLSEQVQELLNNAKKPVDLDSRLSGIKVNDGALISERITKELKALSVPSIGGVIKLSRVEDFQRAILELVNSTRSDVPTTVLLAMKEVVVSCKNITEDVELFESRTEDSSLLSDLQSLKSKLSSALTQLMSAAKNHATAMGTYNAELLEAACFHLNESICKLLARIKVKRNDEDDLMTSSQPPGAKLSSKSADQYSDSNGKRPLSLDIDDLKIYLEQQTDQIVQAIQTLLRSMRKSSYGTDFQDTVDEIADVVNNLVIITRKTFQSESGSKYASSGEQILKDLTFSNSMLTDLGRNISQNPNSKSYKQQLASASYELAKYTKELVSLIE